MPAISNSHADTVVRDPEPDALTRQLVLAEEAPEHLSELFRLRSSPPTTRSPSSSSRATWTSSGAPLLTTRAAAIWEAPIFRPTSASCPCAALALRLCGLQRLVLRCGVVLRLARKPALALRLRRLGRVPLPALRQQVGKLDLFLQVHEGSAFRDAQGAGRRQRASSVVLRLIRPSSCSGLLEREEARPPRSRCPGKRGRRATARASSFRASSPFA